jgi:hypothetical protein
VIDWAAIERLSGLSAWDQLGEAYDREAANIGELLLLWEYLGSYLTNIQPIV